MISSCRLNTAPMFSASNKCYGGFGYMLQKVWISSPHRSSTWRIDIMTIASIDVFCSSSQRRCEIIYCSFTPKGICSTTHAVDALTHYKTASRDHVTTPRKRKYNTCHSDSKSRLNIAEVRTNAFVAYVIFLEEFVPYESKYIKKTDKENYVL